MKGAPARCAVHAVNSAADAPPSLPPETAACAGRQNLLFFQLLGIRVNLKKEKNFQKTAKPFLFGGLLIIAAFKLRVRTSS